VAVDVVAEQRTRRFRQGVIAATALGFAVRAGYVVLVLRNRKLGGDAAYYHSLARLVSSGHGWIEPYTYGFHLGAYPTAAHPPLFPLLLVLASKLGLGTMESHRLAACAAGTAVIPLVALVARRHGGPRAGLIAAVIAALYPYLWVNDVGALSESLLAVFVALILLTADTAAQQPSRRHGVWLGVVIGLAALTRGEQLLLVPLLMWPLMLRGAEAWRERLTRATVATLATLVVVMPWVGWNLTRFEHPVFISTDLGGTIFNTNCDRVWHGEFIGWWTFFPSCPGDADLGQAPDESTRDLRMRALGLRYVRAHILHAPVVVAARVGREWGLYRPLQTRDLDERETEARGPILIGFVAFYALFLLSLPGMLLVHRRHRSVLPFVALAAVVTITAACFYGHPRFRTPVEVAVVVLAALTLDELIRRRRKSDASALAQAAGQPPGAALHTGPLG
jgi:hypothetical protein